MFYRKSEEFGIALRILSGLLFAAMVVVVKMVSEEVPLGEIVFFRSAFALFPLVIFYISVVSSLTGYAVTARGGMC